MDDGEFWDGIIGPMPGKAGERAREVLAEKRAADREERELDIEDFADGDQGVPDNASDDPYMRPLQGQLIGDSPAIVARTDGMKSVQPTKLSHRLKYVAHLKAMGLTNNEIAEKAGYTPSRISVVLNSPHVSAEVERMRRHLLDRDPDIAMRSMIPKALRALDDVLSHETTSFKERVWKKDAAMQLFDRTHGKPTQKIEASGNLLADLFALLDQRDAAPSPKDIAAEARSLDSAEEVIETQGETEKREGASE